LKLRLFALLVKDFAYLFTHSTFLVKKKTKLQEFIMLKRHSLFTLCLIVISIYSCSTVKHGSDRDDEIVLMTYNVENLFDTVHDEGKDDRTYLPRKAKQSQEHKFYCMQQKISYFVQECLEVDWNEEALEIKMQRLAEVILQVKKGKGPDVLYLQEVENLNVLEMLRTKYLEQAGYTQPAILIEGPDKRGIDTAIISRLPLVKEAKLHLMEINLSETKNYRDKRATEFLERYIEKAKNASANGKNIIIVETRGILEANFRLPDGSILTALSVHLPSQGSPHFLRVKGLELLNQIKASLPSENIVVAAGDFNITQKEDQENKLMELMMMPHWYVSHYIGCDSCQGTHNYRGSWSFLDIMFFSKNLGPKGEANWMVIPSSIDVPTGSPHQVSRFSTPQRYGEGKGNYGVSDHWPLTANLRLRKNKKVIEQK
jgi:endonuclease/exonuclease/phosphatase family metal-dependent hydrolase